MIPVGIDLGTTNTLLACDGRVLDLGQGAEHTSLLPSVVAYLPTAATLVGSAARRRRALDPTNTIYSSKRVIGSAWTSSAVASLRENYPFELVEQGQGGVGFRTRRGVVTPVDVAAAVLVEGLQRAGLDGSQLDAVITVPAEFGAAARAATRQAGRQAGLARVRIVDEPVAALRAVLADHPGRSGRHAVYDLGGGTFDFAVIEADAAGVQVIGASGDPFLGGDDIDRALARRVAQRLLQSSGWDLWADLETQDNLVYECEQAKIRLAFTGATTIEPGQIDPAAPTLDPVSVDRAELDGLVMELIQSTFALCDEVLAQTGLRASDLTSVVLAGGSTQLPMVRQAVERYFGRNADTTIDPLEVVALGALEMASDA